MKLEDWLKNLECCIPDCEEKPTQLDNMDNPFCDEHAEMEQAESPEDWEI